MHVQAYSTLQWDATTGVREERDRRPAVPVFLLTYLKAWLPAALNTMYSTHAQCTKVLVVSNCSPEIDKFTVRKAS